MCKRNCAYRGGMTCGHEAGTCCNYSVAAEHAGSKFKTRTRVLMERLGKKTADKEVRQLLQGEFCPLYVWNGKGRPSKTKIPKKEAEEERPAENTQEEEPREKSVPRRYVISPEMEETLLRAYKKGLNDREIEKETGITAYKVRYWRHERKLASNYKAKHAVDLTGARELYEQGLMDTEIGRRLGCSTCAVYQWRQREGLKANREVKRMTREMQELKMKLYREGATDGQIAEQTGAKKSGILSWRKYYHLPPNDKRSLHRVDRVLMKKLYQRGLNDRQIAEKLGCYSSTVGAWRKENSLAPNKTRRRKKTEKDS